MADPVEPGGRRGLSRRQMIKASAAAGAVAWTAPIIIDSLASPAAAVSGIRGGGVCSGNVETDAVKFTVSGTTVTSCTGGTSIGNTSCLGSQGSWSNPCLGQTCSPPGRPFPWATLNPPGGACGSKWQLLLTDSGQCFFEHNQNAQNNGQIFAKYAGGACITLLPAPVDGTFSYCIDATSGGQSLIEVSAIFCCPARPTGTGGC